MSKSIPDIIDLKDTLKLRQSIDSDADDLSQGLKGFVITGVPYSPVPQSYIYTAFETKFCAVAGIVAFVGLLVAVILVEFNYFMARDEEGLCSLFSHFTEPIYLSSAQLVTFSKIYST